MNLNHSYEVCRPKIAVARAMNRCRICGGAILKNEKYIWCWYLDVCRHYSKYFRGKRVGYHVKMKFCRNCSVELLNANKQGHMVGRHHEENVISTIKKLFSTGDRHKILIGPTVFERFLKEKGIQVTDPGIEV